MNRDSKLDVAKGLLICLVVLGHFLEVSSGPSVDGVGSGWLSQPQKFLLTAIYLFHMPAFAALVGATASVRRLGTRVIQAATLLVVMQAGYALVFFAKDGAVPFDWYSPYFVLWFLAAMIWWLMFLPVVVKMRAWAMLPALAISLGIGFIDFDGSVLGVARSAHFLPFFVLGFLYARPLVTRSRSWPSWAPAAGASIALAGTALYASIGPSFAWLYGRETYDSMGASSGKGMSIELLLIPVSVIISIAILAMVPSKGAWLEQTGRHTLPIFLLHPLALIVAGPIMERAAEHVPTVGMLAAAAIGAAIVIAILRLPVFETTLRLVGSILTRRKTHSVS